VTCVIGYAGRHRSVATRLAGLFVAWFCDTHALGSCSAVLLRAVRVRRLGSFASLAQEGLLPASGSACAFPRRGAILACCSPQYLRFGKFYVFGMST